MEWYCRVHFVSAVPMPDGVAEAYGTTINGMWASPDLRSEAMIDEAHSKDRRVLFSVPLIALTPRVYTRSEHQYLLAEVCSDIMGDRSLVPWYYWESEPVYSLCIYSPVFRAYLLERCRAGIDRGMDVVNLDEINCSIGLMNRQAGGSGFCKYCLERFRRHVTATASAHALAVPQQYDRLASVDDEALRRRLREDTELFEYYRRFHELEAFHVVVDLIREISAYARQRNPDFAITANLAGLGNVARAKGDLWGPIWGEHIDFVMMENTYQPDPRGPHLLLPRAKFTAWYRLASSFSSRSPAWICPSIMVPKQLAGQQRANYYVLMFLEAYANGGRWGYYWWPGVDVETRLKATAPEQLKDYVRFISHYRDYYEQASTRNKLAILYLNSAIRRRPDAHFKYIALAQALAEAGYQYDVIYAGDRIYSSDALDVKRLRQYGALLIPECQGLTDTQEDQLAQLSGEHGVTLIPFAANEQDWGLAPGTAQDEAMLFSFWRDYREADRERIVACVSSYDSERPRTSHPLVNVIRYVRGEEQVLHLLNYSYDAASDNVTPVDRLTIRVPWEGSEAAEVRWLSLDGERQLPCRLDAGDVVFQIPRLEMYGLAILRQEADES